MHIRKLHYTQYKVAFFLFFYQLVLHVQPTKTIKAKFKHFTHFGIIHFSKIVAYVYKRNKTKVNEIEGVLYTSLLCLPSYIEILERKGMSGLQVLNNKKLLMQSELHLNDKELD